jgi:acyl-CoA synthetase (AMP-forming)/AMP-acid ligase II
VLASAGVTEESIVVVQLPNIVELVLTYLACARVGAIVSPLPVQFGRHEIGQILDVLQPVNAVITTSDYRRAPLATTWSDVIDSLGSGGPSLLLFDSSERLVPRTVRLADSVRHVTRPRLWDRSKKIDADQICTICWTSGTIAAPKGVPRSHNNWVLYARMVADACDLRDGERILSPFPIVNLSGIGISLLVWLHQAGTLHLHHPFSADVFLEQVARERITFAVAAPAVLTMILQDPALAARYDLRSLRAVLSGASGLSGWMISEYQRQFGIEIINGFGSNEGTTLTSSARDVPDATQRAELFPRIGGRGILPKLTYHGWVQTKLVDPLTKQEIGQPGVPGELLIRSGAVFPGYFRRPDLTDAAFDDEGYFRTGDLFEIRTITMERQCSTGLWAATRVSSSEAV